MITLDTGTFVLILLVAAVVGALVTALPAWRQLAARIPDLPVRGFLMRRGVALEHVEKLQVELRCELCDAKTGCRRLLADGADAPVPGCPNAELFASPRPDASGTPAAPKA